VVVCFTSGDKLAKPAKSAAKQSKQTTSSEQQQQQQDDVETFRQSYLSYDKFNLLSVPLL